MWMAVQTLLRWLFTVNIFSLWICFHFSQFWVKWILNAPGLTVLPCITVQCKFLYLLSELIKCGFFVYINIHFLFPVVYRLRRDQIANIECLEKIKRVTLRSLQVSLDDVVKEIFPKVWLPRVFFCLLIFSKWGLSFRKKGKTWSTRWYFTINHFFLYSCRLLKNCLFRHLRQVHCC